MSMSLADLLREMMDQRPSPQPCPPPTPEFTHSENKEKLLTCEMLDAMKGIKGQLEEPDRRYVHMPYSIYFWPPWPAKSRDVVEPKARESWMERGAKSEIPKKARTLHAAPSSRAMTVAAIVDPMRWTTPRGL